MTRSRNILPPRAYWSKAEVRILRKRYPHDLGADVAAALGRPLRGIYQKAKELGLKKSAKFLASDLSKRIKRGKQHPAMIATRFQRGHVPANKGLRRPGWHTGRMRETQFKRGQMSGAAHAKYVPIGTERVCRDGYLERKITDDRSIYPARRWVAVHRLVWIAERGEIAPGMIVVFKGGMHTTESAAITIDKLECITRVENMRRNSYHNRYPKEIALAIQLRGALIRKINNSAKRVEATQ